MINEEKVKIAVEEFCKNPHWKKELDAAPSEQSKRYTELSFYYSWFLGGISIEEKEELKREKKALLDKFDLEDWKHACRYAGNNPFRGACIHKIGELGGGDWLEERFGNRFGY